MVCAGLVQRSEATASDPVPVTQNLMSLPGPRGTQEEG